MHPIGLVKMLARSVGLTYFLRMQVTPNTLVERETSKFHAFFVLVWKKELINQIKQVITTKITRK